MRDRQRDLIELQMPFANRQIVTYCISAVVAKLEIKAARRTTRMTLRMIVSAAAVAVAMVSFARASEPSWTGRVIIPRSERAVIESTPIIQRPYRPLHFYGNAVRRVYYHDRLMPRPRELARGAGAWVFRR